MKPRVRTACIFVGTVVFVMAFTWGLRVSLGKPYAFPDGWFIGVCVSFGVMLGDRWRKKHLHAGTSDE
jgi:hypothetical protein